MRNIKLLKSDELELLNDIYTFSTINDNKDIVVECRHFNRKTLHSTDSGFIISSKIRKLSITKQAIDYWLEYFKDTTLINVQDAINKLTIMYKDVNLDTLKDELNHNYK